MSYLLNVQKAIADTEKTFECKEYQQGWDESGEDLTYGISCGSEHAVKQQIAPWLIEPSNTYFETFDSVSDQGYSDRVRQINEIIEGKKS